MKGERAPWCQVLVDFDGTIAPDDPTDRIFERFASPLWRVLEEAWQSGRISSRECMQRQVEMLRVSPEALDEEIGNIRIDISFHAFLKFCRSRGAEVKIVSDGLDRVVEAALMSAGLNVPVFANKLEWQGGNRWRLGLPFARSYCRVAAANCKCSHAERFCLRPSVVVGDGKSDFCMATRVDYVIAKGRLADYCRHRGRPHATFTDFSDVTARLSEWLAREEDAPITLLSASAGS
jgi:2,3-diketo-5-methylthio-1-phosphopentane phosphatase